MLMLEVLYGGPDGRFDQGTPEYEMQYELWTVLKDVQSIRVAENSTLFQDPTASVQENMQLLSLSAQYAPLMAQMGMPIPNVQKFFNNALFAFNKQSVDDYWLPPMQQNAPAAGEPQQGQTPPPQGQ
jgi:hypothetical protein